METQWLENAFSSIICIVVAWRRTFIVGQNDDARWLLQVTVFRVLKQGLPHTAICSNCVQKSIRTMGQFYPDLLFEKCEFCEKWDFEKCEFCENWDFEKCDFWIKCGF